MDAWKEGILHLCFTEYKQGNRVSYRIIAVPLSSSGEKQVEVGYKCGEGLPMGMGVGILGSNIILAGGLEAVFDGYANFPPKPRKDVYQFDDNSTYTIPFLQGGKSCPFLAEHNGKLYVLSTFSLKFSAGHHFTPSFEMFDPKEGKWASLPEPPTFNRDYLKYDPFITHAVVGTNIFVSSICNPIFRFNMDDPNQEWKQHKFNMDDPSQEWEFQGLPMEFNGQTLAVETKDGDWVILSCTVESDPIEASDDMDEDDHNEYDLDNFDLEEYHYHRAPPPRDYEWWGTSIRAYLMSKDCKSLKPLKDLKVPEGILPRNRQRVRGIQFKLVHIVHQKVYLVMCVDYGHESKDVEIYVLGFGFQLLPSGDALHFTKLNHVSQFTYHGNGSFEPSTTGIYIHGAFFL